MKTSQKQVRALIKDEKLRLRMFKLFTRYAVADEETGCWNWQGTVGQRGYGSIYTTIGPRGKKTTAHLRAHRVAYSLWNGPLRDGECVLHTCNNPRCVNPDHLIQGTQQENMAHRRNSRGEYYTGDRHNRLTKESLEALRDLIRAAVSQGTSHGLATLLAEEFSIGVPAIRYHVRNVRNEMEA